MPLIVVETKLPPVPVFQLRSRASQTDPKHVSCMSVANKIPHKIFEKSVENTRIS